MLILKITLSLVLLTIVLLVTVFYAIILIYNLILAAPFLPSNQKSLRTVLEKINLNGKRIFYELGSGDGRVISRLAQKYPQMQCYGIELNGAAYILARMRNLFLKHKVRYLYQDLFKTDLSEADVVFTYLFPGPMVELEPKFERELKPGAILISSTFKLPHKQPVKIYKGKGSLSTIYVYQY